MEKLHYKMYKKGRFWVFAGLTAFTLYSQQLLVHADDNANVNDTTKTTVVSEQSSATATVGEASSIKTTEDTKVTEGTTDTNDHSGTTIQPKNDDNGTTTQPQSSNQTNDQDVLPPTDGKVDHQAEEPEQPKSPTESIKQSNDTPPASNAVQEQSVESSESERLNETEPLEKASASVKPVQKLDTKVAVDLKNETANKDQPISPRSYALKTISEVQEVPTTGDLGTGTWRYQDGVLTLTAGEWDDIGLGEDDSEQELPWVNYGQQIKRVEVTGPVVAKGNISCLFSNLYSVEKYDGLDKINMTQVTSMNRLFDNNNALTSLTLPDWDTHKVKYMNRMFYNLSNLTTLDISGLDTSNVEDMSAMFASNGKLKTIDVSNFDTSKVINMDLMFAFMSSLETIDVSNFNTENVQGMGEMFQEDIRLKHLDLSNFKTPNLMEMISMFAGDTALETLDITGLDTTNVVEDMSSIFDGDVALKSLDLSHFKTQNVPGFRMMFRNTPSLTTLILSPDFKTQQATDMESMFENASALTSLDLSSFDTSNVMFMQNMFKGASALTTLNLSGFKPNRVYMSRMFMDASSLTELDLSSFDTSNVQSFTDSLKGLTNLKQLKLGSGIVDLKDSGLEPPKQPGHWQNVGTGTVTKPEGDYHYDTAGLIANYQPEMADTYVLTSLGIPTTQTKPVTRTIKYIDQVTGDNLSLPVIQTTTYQQTALTDAISKQLLGYDTDGDGLADTDDADAAWVLFGDNKLQPVTSPDLSLTGYTAPDILEVPAQLSDLPDHTITVTYGHANSISAEQRVFQRELKYVDQLTQQVLAPGIIQRVIYVLSPVRDQVTGEVLGYDTDGDGSVDVTDINQAWVCTGAVTFAAVDSPDLAQAGYTAPSVSRVVQQAVNLSSPLAQTVTITYRHEVKPTISNQQFTRVVKYVDQVTGKELATPMIQTITYQQTALVDQVTKQIIGYDLNADGNSDTKHAIDAWVPVSNVALATVVSPDLRALGYAQPNMAQVNTLIPKVGLTPNQQLITVTYAPVPVVVDPDVPVQPDPVVSDSTAPSSQVVSPAESQVTNPTSATELPAESQATNPISATESPVKSQAITPVSAAKAPVSTIASKAPLTSQPQADTNTIHLDPQQPKSVPSQANLPQEHALVLPQTNEQSTNWLIALGTAVLGLIGLAGIIKIKH